MTGWLIAILGAIGALVWGMVKADLEDAKVCRWLARKLVYQAALRLPRGERARWREEMIRDLLNLEGRVAPLFWALSVYCQSGAWGRQRGGPSRWQDLVAWVRSASVWLRSQLTSRVRTRPQVMATATVDGIATIHPVGIPSSQDFGTPTLFVDHGGAQPGLPHLSDQAFFAWLDRQRRDFEGDLKRKELAWRQAEPWRNLQAWRETEQWKSMEAQRQRPT